MICEKCFQRYDPREHDQCPHCRPLRRALLVFVLICLATLSLVLHCMTAGCSAGGARKAIVTAADAANVATQVVRAHCRQLAEEGCKTNPCPALDECRRAERLIVDGAASLTAGAKVVNEVIDD
jgi:hypothetical protein